MVEGRGEGGNSILYLELVGYGNWDVYIVFSSWKMKCVCGLGVNLFGRWVWD